jgi:hypothetical protein
MRQIRGWVGILLATVVLAGCGGGGGSKARVTPQPVPAAELSTAAPSSQPDADFLGSTLQDEVPYTDEAGLVSFTSPAHDINCSISDAPRGVSCQLPIFSYKPIEKDQCKGNGVWGSTVELETKKPTFVCATDAIVATKTLPYGKRIEDQELICVSKQDGITCRNARTDHGFRIAQGYYTFY